MDEEVPVFDIEVELSADLADFTGLETSSTFGEVSLWLNSYVEQHSLANGPLPLLGGKYPGPLIKFDDCLNYLFKPYFDEMGIRGDTVEYSKFKGLCLKHMKPIPQDESESNDENE